MLGTIFVILIFLLGSQLTPKAVRGRLWLLFPFSYGTGTLVMGWATYLIGYFASVCFGKESPLLYANIVVMSGSTIFLAVVFWRKGAISFKTEIKEIWKNRKAFWKEAIFFGALFLFITWTMFYVFHVKDGMLYAGYSVFGDYAPHTSMIRSFSWGNNFPTQYPHFGGEDVKYHFMFQFLAGNLEYLGLPIDIAYNLISIFALESFLMMLYMLTVRVTGSKVAGALGSILFFFRSGTAFFRFAWEHFQAGDLWQLLKENTTFIGYTTNEDWGLWNYNVYLNQRHLAFGLLIVSLAIWIYMEWLEAGIAEGEKGRFWLKNCFFTKKAWLSRHWETAVLVGMMLGMCSFWNGAAVIGGLLILAGFGLFSDAKIDYLLTAVFAVVFSLIQSKIFIQGEAMSFSWYWGFLAEDKSITGVLAYLFEMSGVYFIGLLIFIFFLKRKSRAILISFLFPMFFAFCFSLTPDINVNHKYIMISYCFLTMFWAGALMSFWKKGFFRKIVAVVLFICLTVTGGYDFVVILKNNDENHRISVAVDSELERWISQTLGKGDLMLTPEYSINEVTMSGEMLYCGWPYYAWSAGYDTYTRAEKAKIIYTTQSKEQLKKLVAEEKITYILFEEGMEFEQASCREDIIKDTYPLVYKSEDGRIRIYET